MIELLKLVLNSLNFRIDMRLFSVFLIFHSLPISDKFLNFFFVFIWDFILLLIHKILNLIDQRFKLIFWFNKFLSLSIFFSKFLCISFCFCDIFIRDISWSLNSYLLRFSSWFFLSMYLENSVSINVKSHLNLWLPSSHWRDSFKIEHTKRLIISRKLSFPLSNMHSYSILIVSCCCINIWFFSWDCCISWDHHMRDSSLNFHSKRKRSYIKQKNILNISLYNSSLNCSSLSYWFIWIHSWFWLFPKDVFYDFLNFKHSCWTSNKNNIVNFRFI